MSKYFTLTRNDEYDRRKLSSPAKKNWRNKLAHFIGGCWYLESLQHASTNECLYCGKHYDEKRLSLLRNTMRKFALSIWRKNE